MSLHDASSPSTAFGEQEERSGVPDRRWTIAWCHTADSGGSKRAAFEMVRELAKRGHVIDEYILRIGEPNLKHWPLTPFIRNSYRVSVPPLVNQYRPYLLALWMGLLQEGQQMNALARQYQDLGSVLKARGYDFVHLDHCFPSYTVQLSEHLSLPSIVYSHEATDARFQGQGLFDCPQGLPWLKRKYLELCNRAIAKVAELRRTHDLAGLHAAGKILTNSCYSREALYQRNQMDSSVCRYGVDVDTFKPLGLPRKRTVLSAGRIVEKKQHHLVIESVATIAESERPCVIIATPETMERQEDPSYGHRLEQMAKDLNVNLEIRRKPPEHDLVQLYNEVTALVFLPNMEPFGLVALEAMACGAPVIGVREAGIRESVIDGMTGILVDRNPDDAGNAIVRLLRDPELRDRMSRQAVEYVRREWVWERTVDCYLREVERLMTSGVPARLH
jgi:glycosyltransferase involved in cell wall biosynthesis